MLDKHIQEELDAHTKLKRLLNRIEAGKASDDQKKALRDLLQGLIGNAALPSASPTFTEEDAAFFQQSQELGFGPDVLNALKVGMHAILANPRKGKPLVHSVYGPLFKKMLPSVTTGKVVIHKLEIRLRYRLIYAYGGSLTRPYFIRFNHRKDIYKHAGFGKCSS